MKKNQSLLRMVVALVLATLSMESNSGDLFTDRTPADFVKGSAFVNGTTMGDYPIFTGSENWKLASVTSRESNTLRDATSTTYGTVILEQKEPNGDWFAFLNLTTDIAGAGGGKYVSGSPCAGRHMVAINKGRGYDDNCLTIDAHSVQAGTRLGTYFSVKVIQTRIGGRLYTLGLGLNAELLGFRETSAEDWNNPDALESSPSRKKFVQKLQQWGELLQAATDKAIDYSKPKNAFDGIPSYRALLPVPSDLADGTFSQNFISAVESTRFKPTFRAIAYSKTAAGTVRWRNDYGSGSQEVADKLALEACEKGRAANAPPCKLYDLDKTPSKAAL